MRPVRLGNVWVPPITFAILVALVACFVVSGVIANFVPSLAGVLEWLPVSSARVLDGEVWRLLTYALLHSLRDPFHLLFNALVIYFFGGQLEERWGARRYLLFLFLTVLMGGVFVVAAGALGLGVGVAAGISAFGFGLSVAWGLTFRERRVLMMMVFPVTGLQMVWITLGLWVLDAVSLSGTSAAAHLGGMVTAAVLVLGVWRPNYVKAWAASLKEKLGGKKQPQLFVVPRPSPRPDDKKWVN